MTGAEINSNDKWILQSGTFCFLMYCSLGMVVPMSKGLGSKKDLVRLFTHQTYFLGLSISGLCTGILFIVQGYYQFPVDGVLIGHNLYGCFEMAISWSRMPRQLFDKRQRQYSKVIFLFGEFMCGSAIPWHILALSTGKPSLFVVSKWWNAGCCMAFVAMEFNSLIQSRRMLKKMPPNFENFATTRRVLEHLTEANAAACVAGVYSLFFTIYGFLALDCLTLFGGSLAFKAYASVFAITSAQRTGTRKSVGESLSLASARSGQSLQKTIVEKSSLEEDV